MYRRNVYRTGTCTGQGYAYIMSGMGLDHKDDVPSNVRADEALRSEEKEKSSNAGIWNNRKSTKDKKREGREEEGEEEHRKASLGKDGLDFLDGQITIVAHIHSSC